MNAVIVGLCALLAATTGARDRGARPRSKSPFAAGSSRLIFEILDAATGKPMPGRLTFVGVSGTRNPRLNSPDLAGDEGAGVAAYSRVFSARGIGTVRVPKGTYDVYVSRGPEWSLHVARKVKIGPKKDARVKATLAHVVPTPGWMSGDFHVHAEHSYDSFVPMRHRVHEFLADGIDMIMSTDHNTVADYAPEIAALGVGNLVASVKGEEITTATLGHFGAFPLPPHLEERADGEMLAQGSTAKGLLKNVRRMAPDAVINLHHPQVDHIGYFAVSGLNPAQDRVEKAGFPFDFDALEVINGYSDSGRSRLDHLLDDWFGLLDHGHMVTATGNSDSHHLTHNLAGYPRNYVAMEDDRPSAYTDAALARGLKAHHSFITTGPILDIKAGNGGIGDIVAATKGHIKIDVTVRAAPWIDVDKLTVIVGGKTAQVIRIPASTTPVRLVKQIDVPVTRDTYVVMRVDGDRPLAPIIGVLKIYEIRPLALANPIFVDADGDGKWLAPKLSRPEDTKGSAPPVAKAERPDANNPARREATKKTAASDQSMMP